MDKLLKEHRMRLRWGSTSGEIYCPQALQSDTKPLQHKQFWRAAAALGAEGGDSERSSSAGMSLLREPLPGLPGKIDMQVR